MVLSMYGAREVDEHTAPELYAIVRELAGAAGLPMPQRLHRREPAAQRLRHRPQSRACRGRASRPALLARVSDEELAGVLAHELAPCEEPRHADHDHHRDDRRRHLHAGQFRLLLRRPAAIRWDGRRLPWLIVLAPIAAMLVQMAISRTREFEADEARRRICGHPLWLAAALAQHRSIGAHEIAEPPGRRQSRHGAYVHHQSAAWRTIAGLFASHPPRRSASRGCGPWPGAARRREAGPWG